MGYYVNPSTESKEEFLVKVGTQVDRRTPWSSFTKDCLPVILIDNGMFSAAGVAYCEAEYNSFLDPHDRRTKFVFSVPIDKLKEVSDLPKDFERTD